MKYSVLLSVLIVIALAIVIGSGFDTREDVVLDDYRTHADGRRTDDCMSASIPRSAGITAPSAPAIPLS